MDAFGALSRRSETASGASGWLVSLVNRGPGLAPGAYYGPSTGTASALYLHVVGHPADGIIRVRGLERRATQVTLLANGTPLEFDQHGGVLEQGLLRIGLPSGLGDALAPHTGEIQGA